jgi:hypothetical protein
MRAAVGGGGGSGALTATVVAAVAEPPLFVAVSVYAVVCVGLTVSEVPFTTLPFTLNDVAPMADHESVDDCPATMLAGVEVKLAITGGAEAGKIPNVWSRSVAINTVPSTTSGLLYFPPSFNWPGAL